MSFKASHLLRSIVAIAGLCAPLLLAAPALVQAQNWLTCSGQTLQWESTINILRNSASIPDAEPLISAFSNGINQWNSGTGIVNRIQPSLPDDMRIERGDGINEVGVVPASSLDGALGKATLLRDTCFGVISLPGTDYEIYEGDIWVSDVLATSTSTLPPPFERGPGDAPLHFGTKGRCNLVHEFGHFFGLQHEEGHDVMRAAAPVPISGGAEPAVIWASDAFGITVPYGISALPNLVVSSTGFRRIETLQSVDDPFIGHVEFPTFSDIIDSLDVASEMSVCQRSSPVVKFHIANTSNTIISGFDFRIRMSQTAPPMGYAEPGLVVTTGTHALSAFESGTFELPVFVPDTVPIAPTGMGAPWFIYLDVDPSNILGERDEGDNTTVSAVKLRVTCPPASP